MKKSSKNLFKKNPIKILRIKILCYISHIKTIKIIDMDKIITQETMGVCPGTPITNEQAAQQKTITMDITKFEERVRRHIENLKDEDYANDQGIEEENDLYMELYKNGYDLEDPENRDDQVYCLRASDHERASLILSHILPRHFGHLYLSEKEIEYGVGLLDKMDQEAFAEYDRLKDLLEYKFTPSQIKFLQTQQIPK